jgi:flagellin
MTRIYHNTASQINQKWIRNNYSQLSDSIKKLSTGERINSAKDDVVGLSTSEELRSHIRGMRQASQNASHGNALLNIAEGAAGEITSMLQRMRELSVQSSNDTINSDDREYLQNEFDSLRTEITRISQGAQYNGLTLLDGGANSFGAVGSNASVIHLGSGNKNTIDRMEVSIGSLTMGALGLASLSITGSAGALASLSEIDEAIVSVNNVRSSLGSWMTRLDFAVDNLEAQGINFQNSESKIRDVDMAKESTAFTRDQILVQVSTSMLGQANTLSDGLLQLFK